MKENFYKFINARSEVLGFVLNHSNSKDLFWNNLKFVQNMNLSNIKACTVCKTFFLACKWKARENLRRTAIIRKLCIMKFVRSNRLKPPSDFVGETV